MGEAKRRGTFEERAAAATPRPRQQTQYLPRFTRTTSALNRLFLQFKVGPTDETIQELNAAAKAEQKRLAAERAAREASDAV